MTIQKLDEKNTCRLEEDGSISISVWWSNGSMMYPREDLPPNHPGSIWQAIVALGKNPTDYGVKGEFQCPCCGAETTAQQVIDYTYGIVESSITDIDDNDADVYVHQAAESIRRLAGILKSGIKKVPFTTYPPLTDRD